MSIDGGVDRLLAHGDVDPEDVPLLVSGALYSRPLEELHRTAILVTGTNDHVIDEMARLVRRSFFGPFRVSLMSECKGGNAVAGGTVARIGQLIDLPGSPALVIGGGPVGARVAGLLARAGCQVVLTVFDDAEAEERQAFIRGTFSDPVEVIVWKSGEPLEALVEEARIAVTAGPPGLLLLPRSTWEVARSLELMVDVSGAEPAAIEGVDGRQDGDPLVAPGRSVRAVGGLAVSRYKIVVHREAVRRLFEPPATVLGPLEIAAIADRLIGAP